MVQSGLHLRVIGLALLILLWLAVPAAAHGNYLTADSQVSADGVVRIEGVFMVTEGWVVIHTDAQGDVGEVIGHIKPENNEFLGNLSVEINQTYWANVTGGTIIWAVLHHDANNDGTFKEADDPPIGGYDTPDWAVRLHVDRGEQSAYVLAEREHAQKTNTSAVNVRRVHLPEDGYIVIRANANGHPGEIIGNRSLSAGAQENVSVSIEEHAYHHRPEQFSLWAVIYRSDGSGTFDDGDMPIAVNGTPVASQFKVQRTGDLEADHTHNTSPTQVAETPTAAEHTGHQHEHEQTESTQSPTPTAKQTPTQTETQRTRDTPTSTPGQHGLGMLSAILAWLLILLVVTRRIP